MLKNAPLFYADRTKGTTWRQHRAQINLWKDLHDPDTTQTVDLYKKAIAYTLRGQASRAVELHGPGTPSFNAALTVDAYLDTLQGIFQRAAESAMARLDFEARKQSVREPMGEYVSEKIALYHASEPVVRNRNYVYLCQHVLRGVYSSFVKSEVLRAAPENEQTLTTALMTAVGQGREAYEIGAGVVTNLDGLASIRSSQRYGNWENRG